MHARICHLILWHDGSLLAILIVVSFPYDTAVYVANKKDLKLKGFLIKYPNLYQKARVVPVQY